jgi:hypothetical protein
MRRSGTTVLMIVFLVGLAAVLAAAEQNKGAEKMALEGGSRGPVPFPHRQHQDNLTDCNACHALFPQETGAIEKLKAEGTLKRQQVMNKQCIACHRENKREGKAAGPTLCSQCHQRK